MSEKMKIMPSELLDKELMKLVNDNIDETNLKKLLNEIFISKGMSAGTVNEIFKDSNDKDAKKSINLLNYYEKLNLVKGFNEYYPSLGLKAEEYFSEKIIDEWETLERKEVEEIDVIEFKKFNKINDETFLGKVSYEYIIELFQQNKIKYRLDLQREPQYIKIGKNYIAVPSVDESNVESIKDSMIRDDFESSLITLAYLSVENEESRISFNEEYLGDIGTLLTDKLILADGNHRILACIRYMLEYHAEHGNYPERYFSVVVVEADEYRIQRIVKQSFMRAKEVSAEYLKAITADDYNIFIDKTINQSVVLKNNVAPTFEGMVAMNKLTTIKVIRDAIECLNIQVNDKSVQRFKSKSIADNLDILIDLTKQSNIDVNYYNLYSVYVWFCYKIEEYGNDLSYYYKLIDKLEALTKADIKKLKLGNKNYNLEELIKYFDVFEEK